MNERHHEHETGRPPALGELPREVQPAHDLWPGIERRLTPRAELPRRWLRPDHLTTWLAAAAVLTLGVGLGFLLRGGPGPVASAGGVTPSGQVQPAAGPGSPSGPHSPALAAYRSATDELRAGLDARLATLDADTRRLVTRELARIDTAIAEIERALAGAPDDAMLETFLLARYRQQVDLLHRWIPAAG